MAKKNSETDVLSEAQSIAKVIAPFTELPSRIDRSAFESQISQLDDHLRTVDTIKKQLTAAVNEKDAVLKDVKAQMVDIREAVKGSYGSDSTEYELVGGTRKSERKKPGRMNTGK